MKRLHPHHRAVIRNGPPVRAIAFVAALAASCLLFRPAEAVAGERGLQIPGAAELLQPFGAGDAPASRPAAQARTEGAPAHRHAPAEAVRHSETLSRRAPHAGRDAAGAHPVLSGRGFSNACRPPAAGDAVAVPKTLEELRAQVGTGFRTARRGPFLLAGDLDAEAFSVLVDGVLACCRTCLEKDYFRTDPAGVVTIYIFRDEESYAYNVRRLFRMDPISPYGHYGHRDRYLVVNYATGPGTLAHELTHALMAGDFPAAPIWISEGLASLYEQCRVVGDSLVGEPNWRLGELREAARAGSLPSLSRLLRFSPGEFRARRETLHYAMSRYFCKFLESRGELRKVYRAFRDGHRRDPTGLAAIEMVTGRRLEALEKEWHAWILAEPAPPDEGY